MIPSVWLFLLAPLVGEWLLGNQKISDLHVLPLMALLYGCGAILIREVTRRTKRGYPTMLGLGVAYALFEEGVVDQLFFNMNYFDGQQELSATILPFMGIDVWLTLLLVAMHAVWSTFIPIVLVEMVFRNRGELPWLGRIGLVVVGAMFVAGSILLGYFIHRENQFWAPVPQLLILCAMIAAVVVAAFRIRHLALPKFAIPLPKHPWMVGILTLVVSTLYMLTGSLPGWTRVAACLLLAGGTIVLFHDWSRKGWSDRYTLAAIAGSLATYGWLGLFMVPESGPKTTWDHVGSVVLVIVVLYLLAMARRNTVKPGAV